MPGRKKGRHTMARFKLFRYRKPSVNSLLGVTRVKRAVKRKSGWNAATRLTRAPTNMKRTVLRRGGYYSGPMRFWRWLFGKR
jgi:hypothetical protein